MNQLGTRIKSLMNSSGIANQDELSRLTGIPKSTLSRIINGKGSSRPAALKKLCDHFKISLHELCTGISSTHNKTQNFKNTAEVLQFLMTDVSIGQNELARATEISQQAINKILSGKTQKISDSTLKKLAQYFGVSIEQLGAKAPIDSARVTGTINEATISKKEIPLLDWDNLILLPDALQNKSNQFLSKFYGKGIYATTVAKGAISMTSVIKTGDLLVMDFEKCAKKGVENGDMCIVLSRNTILIGDVSVKENHITLLPVNVDKKAITLMNGEYRILGIILQINKKD